MERSSDLTKSPTSSRSRTGPGSPSRSQTNYLRERAYDQLIRRCKLQAGEEQHLIKTMSKLRKKVESARDLIQMFGNRCYGKEKESKRYELAKAFCVQAFGDIDMLWRRGPKAAWEKNLQKMMENAEAPRTQFEFMFNARGKTYNIGRVLGQGVSAEVYFGEMKAPRQKVAFKVFKHEYTKLARKEAKILQKINNENCIKLIDSIEKFQWPYHSETTSVLIFEYATKKELVYWLMNSGAMNTKLARWVFKQTMMGLMYCHGQNIAHLDVKADNILLTSGPRVLLADFGFARECEERELIKEICGTPQYYSPEMVQRQPHYRNVDIFALGVTYFMMRTANHPFERAAETDDFYKNAMKGDWPKFWRYHMKSLERQRLPWTLIEEERELIQMMMEPNMNKRATFKDIWQHPFISNKKLDLSPDEANHELRQARQLASIQKMKDYADNGGGDNRDAFDEAKWRDGPKEGESPKADGKKKEEETEPDITAPLYHTDIPESGGTWFYSKNPPRWIIKHMSKVLKKEMKGKTDFSKGRRLSRMSDSMAAETAAATAAAGAEALGAHSPRDGDSEAAKSAPAAAAALTNDEEVKTEENDEEFETLSSAARLGQSIPPEDMATHKTRMKHGIFMLNFKLNVAEQTIHGTIQVWACPTIPRISIVEFLFDSSKREFVTGGGQADKKDKKDKKDKSKTKTMSRAEFFSKIFDHMLSAGAASLMANTYNVEKDLEDEAKKGIPDLAAVLAGGGDSEDEED